MMRAYLSTSTRPVKHFKETATCVPVDDGMYHLMSLACPECAERKYDTQCAIATEAGITLESYFVSTPEMIFTRSLGRRSFSVAKSLMEVSFEATIPTA